MRPASFRRRAITGILLLCVTGLDILPTAVLWVLQAAGMHAVRASMEWWNEQVDGFVYTALWESHYLSGLIACLMAFLLLWAAPRQAPASARMKHALLAGAALASAAGGAIYVAFVFGIFLIGWTAVALAKRWRRETAVLTGAGLAGMALSLPFALSLRGPALGGPPLQFWIRPFYPVQALFEGQTIGKGWVLPLANALALPLNYFLELGFFLAAALVWWQQHRASGRPLTRTEAATWLMIATSAVTCTFLRSSVIGNNDLGWRGFLIAQFGLLLLAVDVLSDWNANTGRDGRAFLTVLLVLGAAGSAYELAINRFFPLLADGGIIQTYPWLAPDRQAGRRNYAQREAGAWAAASTPPTAMVQFNPHTDTQNTSALLYSDRPMLAGNETCLSTFGGDPALCAGLIATLDRVYPPAGQAARQTSKASAARSPSASSRPAIPTPPGPIVTVGSGRRRRSSPTVMCACFVARIPRPRRSANAATEGSGLVQSTSVTLRSPSVSSSCRLPSSHFRSPSAFHRSPPPSVLTLPTVIAVDQLRKTYGQIAAVNDISFTAQSGEIFGLLGPNGAGKTTAIGCISGLLTPTSGHVRIMGHDVVREGAAARRLLGVVPQEISLYEDLSALENLAYWGGTQGMRNPLLRQRIQEVLAITGLEDRSREPVKQFSGGMRRRLNFACGIVHQPKVVLLDEPTVGVDPQSRVRLLELVRAQAQAGACVLYTTHYMEEAETLCHRLAIVDHGNIIAAGTLPELRALLAERDLLRLAGIFQPEAARAALQHLDHIEILQADENLLILSLPEASRRLPAIFSALAAAGAEVRGTTLTQPSLESLFIKLTGKELRE